VSAANPLHPLSLVLNALRIPFIVIGSAASSARGLPRSTQDIDLIVHIGAFQVERLATALGKDWYAEPDQMRQAIQNGRAFNVIHIPTGWKIDLFPAQTDFHDSEMQRATPAPVMIDGELVICPVSTAEDIVLAKLCWYKDGGQVSDRQWSDIGGVIATNSSLDVDYLRLWAGRLQVTDLLEKALIESATQ
jgi:hypothetical protein